MNRENTAKERSKKFAIRIVNLYRYLCDNKKEYVLAKQILRSSTSIGANSAEAEYGISGNDFSAKVYITLKECAKLNSNNYTLNSNNYTLNSNNYTLNSNNYTLC